MYNVSFIKKNKGHILHPNPKPNCTMSRMSVKCTCFNPTHDLSLTP